MMPFYVFRERIRTLYQKYDLYLVPGIKFFVGLIVFFMLNRTIGYDTRLAKLPVVLILSLLSAFIPSSVLVLVAALVSLIHVYSVSKILSIIIVLIMLILYLFYIRLTPKMGVVVLAMPILYLLKIPYVIPLLLGVIATPVSAIASACGIVIYYLFAVIQDAVNIQVGASIEDSLQLYKDVCDQLFKNKEMIMTILIFTLVIGIVYFVRKLKIDYAYEISIATGTVACILCFLISDLNLDISEKIMSMIFGSLISGIITYIISFFKQALDYTAVERTQFEDDDYVYYVKAVPKINVTAPQMNVKRINPQKSIKIKEEMLSEQEEYEDEYDENDYKVTGETYSQRD